MLKFKTDTAPFKQQGYKICERVAIFYPLKSQQGVVHGKSTGIVIQQCSYPLVQVDGGDAYFFHPLQLFPVKHLNKTNITDKEYSVKLLINKPIKLYENWKEETLEVDLFKRCNVFVKNNVVYEQKINLYKEEEFCDVIGALEYLSSDGFAIEKCKVYSEGSILFVWD